MRFHLDTNIVSHVMKFPDGAAAKRVSELDTSMLSVSSIVAAELRFGAMKKGSQRLALLVEEILTDLNVLPWDQPADVHYARLRTELERAGLPIGQNDMLIAAHALAMDATLVTDNEREFARVTGLKTENWLQS
ncbi:type II toxin-antitoxin system VapC family toxin [Pararhizobium mangrovi]|uniref:Type II toxin-antitoxin system VapC family toxin n=1 Tax=Pararhizobium mangrovi TaxID=2590452 RepID=A0A506UAG4_9HYPH|nr:type II toxin-antitoxin system VapC family toxin [Pararhizobium mangrovi]TPW29955.1 type II toxin-antitoxin system VapC family toxin [Pararhizobium mangrovi]